MNLFHNVTCRNCGEGPDQPLCTKDATTWAMKHGKDVHDNPYQGMRYTALKTSNTNQNQNR